MYTLELAYDMKEAGDVLQGIAGRVGVLSDSEKKETGTGWVDLDRLSGADQQALGRYTCDGGPKPFMVAAGPAKDLDDWEMDMHALIVDWLRGEGVTLAGNTPEDSLTSDLAVYLTRAWPART